MVSWVSFGAGIELQASRGRVAVASGNALSSRRRSARPEVLAAGLTERVRGVNSMRAPAGRMALSRASRGSRLRRQYKIGLRSSPVIRRLKRHRTELEGADAGRGFRLANVRVAGLDPRAAPSRGRGLDGALGLHARRRLLVARRAAAQSGRAFRAGVHDEAPATPLATGRRERFGRVGAQPSAEHGDQALG